MDRLKRRIICILFGTLSFAGVADAANVTYEHDAQGRVSKATYDNGAYVDYSYDANGNLTTSVRTLPPDTTAPTAPESLIATRASHTNANLTWPDSTDTVGVTGYRVERCAGASCTTFSPIATPTVGNYSDTSLTAGMAYRYRVRASDATGNLSDYSPIATVAALETTPPSTPTSITATPVSQTQINVTWPVSTDNVGVRDYLVERCTGATCSNFDLAATRTTNRYEDSGVSAGVTYRYRVLASDTAGNFSGYSPIAAATAFVTPPDQEDPTVPAGLGGSAPNSNLVNLGWSASSDNVGVTGYKIYRNGVPVGTSNTNSYADTNGVIGTTTYSYQVSAYDAAENESGLSLAANVTTPDSIAPTAPSGLSVSAASPTQINLSWIGSSDTGGSGLAGYRVYRNGTYLLTVGSASHSDTGLSAGAAYTYYIVAVDGAGNMSSASNSAGATTPVPLQVSLNSGLWTWFKAGSQPASQSPPAVATGSGGAGNYVYTWQYISGDTLITASTPNSSSTIWTRSTTSIGVTYEALWRCRVSDSAGTVVFSSNVFIEFRRETNN